MKLNTLLSLQKSQAKETFSLGRHEIHPHHIELEKMTYTDGHMVYKKMLKQFELNVLFEPFSISIPFKLNDICNTLGIEDTSKIPFHLFPYNLTYQKLDDELGMISLYEYLVHNINLGETVFFPLFLFLFNKQVITHTIEPDIISYYQELLNPDSDSTSRLTAPSIKPFRHHIASRC